MLCKGFEQIHQRFEGDGVVGKTGLGSVKPALRFFSFVRLFRLLNPKKNFCRARDVLAGVKPPVFTRKSEQII
jgi:hypothetical protein